jgi:hypothetical protein
VLLLVPLTNYLSKINNKNRVSFLKKKGQKDEQDYMYYLDSGGPKICVAVSGSIGNRGGIWP